MQQESVDSAINENDDELEASDDDEMFFHEESDEDLDEDVAMMAAEDSDSDMTDSDHDQSDNSDSDQSDASEESDEYIQVNPTDDPIEEEEEEEEVPEIVDSDDEKQVIPPYEEQNEIESIEYPYGIHEIHAALWCNEDLLQRLINIMTVLEHKPESLEKIIASCWNNFEKDGLFACIYNIINEVINLINNQFKIADSFTFKILMNIIIDCSESVSWVLHWLQKQHFNIKKLLSLNTKWDLIRLYLLCYKPFEKCQSVSQLRIIKRSLQSLYHEFQTNINEQQQYTDPDENIIVFANVNRIRFLYRLIHTICDELSELNKNQTVQYVIQQYICNFAFNTFDVLPNEEFMFYLISLLSDKADSNVDDDEKMSVAQAEEDGNGNGKFIADSYTKQEIASKILKLIAINDDTEILRILNRLNDALNVSQLLSCVLLRAAESEQHSKWLKKSKKKQLQTPSEKDITNATKQLKGSEKKSYLYQLLAVAKCKVILHYAVANMKKLQDSYLEALSKMFLTKSKSSAKTQYQSLINGLGFFFFAEFWRQKGSLNACKLRKNRKFREKMKALTHIFEPEDMNADGGDADIIILKSKYKHLDDNIFNLLISDGNKLQTLKASKQTLNSIFKKLSTSVHLSHLYKDNEINLLETKPKRRKKTTAKATKDRFTMLSQEMYKAITSGEKMAEELQLEQNEIVHLIGAVFNCAFLYGGNNEERIYLWLRNQIIIPTPSRMHFLIGQLLNNSSPDSTLKYDTNRAPPLEQMLRIRLAWHLFGVCASINKSNPFYVLLTDPLYYKDGFVIGMPECQQMALLKAMKGHSVFICPNKHLYFVANCGATKESGKCYQCNAAVGNQKNNKPHIAAEGNKKLGRIGNNGEIIPDEYGANNGVAQIPSEYMATGYIDTRGNDDCSRNLSEIAVYIIRCFVLCMLWLHHSERSSDEFPSHCQEFMYGHESLECGTNNKRQNDAQLSVEIHDKIKKYIKKIQKKLGRSIEDTFYVLHAMIHKLYINYDLILDGDDNDSEAAAKKDVQSRLEFEAFFMTRCVEPIMQNLDETITNVRSVVSSDTYKKYWSKRIDMGFTNENKNDIEFKKSFINSYSPHLFLPFRHITLSNFRSYVLANADPEIYPVTFGIIDALDNIGLSIFATQYIPSIVCWMKLVHQRLSGRISKKEINQIDLKTNEYKYNAEWLLNKCREEEFGDDKKWNNALIGFVNAWNDVAKRVTTKESELGARIFNEHIVSKRKQNEKKRASTSFLDIDVADEEEKKYEAEEEEEDIYSDDLQEYARRIVIRYECKTVPIAVIVAKDAKVGIKPNEVPLKLCINAVEGQMDSSLMIQGILDHLVAANRGILQFCKQYNERDEDLYASMTDFIDLTHISRRIDVVDINESELLSILQDCTQQSLEYGISSSFEMNLALLESKLYERYIIGRKLINYAKGQQLRFVFAGYHDIKSYVDRINVKFSISNNKKININELNEMNNLLYFEECSKELLDSVSLKLRIKSDRKIFNKNKERNEKNEYELRIIKAAKKGIEQTLIALLRWPKLPNKNGSISKFMKENLKLYEEEYELFESMSDALALKDCHSLWILLDRLYTLKEGKWCQIPSNIPHTFCKKIVNPEIIMELKQFVVGCDADEMLQLLIDWKEFMQNILSNEDHLKHANQTTLISYLNYSISNPYILKEQSFPTDIKLVHCVFAYEIAAKQFKSKAIQT